MDNNNVLLEEIDKKKKLLNLGESFPLDVKLSFIYHSNAMEGNTLTLQETKVVLDRGLTVGGRTVREHIETRNTGEAFDLMLKIFEERKPLSNEIIQLFHSKIMHGLLEEPGVYRDGVELEMKEYIQNLLEKEMHPIEKAAYLYYEFIHIHPFVDGNEQVARLLMNLYLLQQGYPIVVLRKEEQVKYYKALQKADRGDLSMLTRIIAENIRDTMRQLKGKTVSTRELSRFFIILGT